MDKHYLTEVPREELKDMILYPAEVWNELYEIIAEQNGDYAADLAKWILGEKYQDDVRFDNTSYDWWMNIKPGHYELILGVTDYDYFSEDDAKKFKELQAKVKKLSDEVQNLEDTVNYYDKMGELEDEADKLADEALQIVVKIMKQAEEVSDDQILDEFIDIDMGEDYYYLGDDKTKIYRDYTKAYKTNVKKGQ